MCILELDLAKVFHEYHGLFTDTVIKYPKAFRIELTCSTRYRTHSHSQLHGRHLIRSYVDRLEGYLLALKETLLLVALPLVYKRPVDVGGKDNELTLKSLA